MIPVRVPEPGPYLAGPQPATRQGTATASRTDARRQCDWQLGLILERVKLATCPALPSKSWRSLLHPTALKYPAKRPVPGERTDPIESVTR